MLMKYAAANTKLVYMVLKFHKMVKFGLRMMLNSSQHCSKTFMGKGLWSFSLFVRSLTVVESQSIFQRNNKQHVCWACSSLFFHELSLPRP